MCGLETSTMRRPSWAAAPLKTVTGGFWKVNVM